MFVFLWETSAVIYQEPPNTVIQKAKSAQVSGKENLGLISPALTGFFHTCQKGMGDDRLPSDPKHQS